MEIAGILDQIRAANGELAVMEWDFGSWESGVSLYQADLDDVDDLVDGYGIDGGWRLTEANYFDEALGYLTPFLNSRIDPDDPEADAFDPNDYSDDIPNALIIDAHTMTLTDVIGDSRPINDIVAAVQAIDAEY